MKYPTIRLPYSLAHECGVCGVTSTANTASCAVIQNLKRNFASKLFLIFFLSLFLACTSSLGRPQSRVYLIFARFLKLLRFLLHVASGRKREGGMLHCHKNDLNAVGLLHYVPTDSLTDWKTHWVTTTLDSRSPSLCLSPAHFVLPLALSACPLAMYQVDGRLVAPLATSLWPLASLFTQTPTVTPATSLSLSISSCLCLSLFLCLSSICIRICMLHT